MKHERLLFPNTKDIPVTSWNLSKFDLKVENQDDVEWYQSLERDLLRLAKRVNRYLTALEIDGKVIIYYHCQNVTVIGKAKKSTAPHHIFSFGVITTTLYGESRFNVYVNKERTVYVECSGDGIAQNTVNTVICNFNWNKPVSLKIRFSSEFKWYVKSAYDHTRWFGLVGQAFDVPIEEYNALPTNLERPR